MSGSRRARCIFSAAAVVIGSAIAFVVTAAAHHVQSVAILGTPVVGSTLTAVPEVNVLTAALDYRWQRCATAERSSCARIDGVPSTASYTVTAADVDKRLAVRVFSVVAGVTESRWSPMTGVVTAPPAPAPAPVPTPTATPTPTPAPPPRPTPSSGTTRNPDPPDSAPAFDQSKGSSPAPAGAGDAAPSGGALRYLRPFPVVRVKGTLVPGGARISLLRIKAPTAATVAVRCKGPRCHLRRRSFGSGRVERLERFLRAGTRVTIRISKANAIGKYVRLTIRDGSAPKRRDACLLPGEGAPVACPAA